jgi:hypothetical protein
LIASGTATFLLFLSSSFVGSLQIADVTSSRAIDISCVGSNQKKSFDLPPLDSHSTLRFAGPAAWVQIDDVGQESLVTTLPAAPVIRLSQPLRNGQQWVHAQPDMEIRIRRVELTRAAGRFKVFVHCSSSPELDRHLGWLHRLSLLDAQINAPSDRSRYAQIHGEIEDLAAVAPDETSKAFALHYQALALDAEIKPKQASLQYSLAERAWQALGELERAQASHLGRVDSEYSAGDSAQVLDDTAHLADKDATVSYFSARMENNRCLVLDDSGRFSEANACYEWTLSALKQLDELPEYANTLRNLASLQRKLGNLALAKRLALQGLDFASGPFAPMTRGRLHLMLGVIASQQGDVATAIAQLELAILEFDKAELDALSWRVATRLYQAILLEQIGSDHEARFALGMATGLLATENLPVQLAQSARIFSDLEADAGHFYSASFWSHTSEQMYARLGMAPAREVTRLARLQFQAHNGDYTEVESALVEKHDILPLYEPQWQLLFAGFALHQNRLADAQRLLAATREKPLALREQVRFAELEAEYSERSGEVSGAQSLLLQTAQRLNALAARSGSPILRDLITRQQLPLQHSAVAMALRHVADSSEAVDLHTLWPWLAMQTWSSAGVYDEKANAKVAESFDRAVAAELLTPPSQKKQLVATAQQELMSLLAQLGGRTDATIPTMHTFPLAALQQRLDADTAFIAYLDGESRGALLWVTRDTAHVLDAAVPDEIRTSTAALSAALRSPDSPVGGVQSAAKTLSAQLLRGAPVGMPPKHLLVLADETTQRVSWSVLAWPGQTEPLLDTTTVELVSFDATNPGQVNRDAARLHVIVASQQQGGDNQLASLATANAESHLIQAALATPTLANPAVHPISIADGAAATREAVLSAFAEPGSWVHIAAHGTAQPQRIGYAGLWLEPSGKDKTPAFLSWLDILDKGVRADLVVLNACQLGDSGNAINGNLSFAAAVSRAGAKQVVAALWPVSDSAAALWVPAFYAALAADQEHNAAAALRAAQLRLRASRAFAHPFFWAGMQTQSRLSNSMHSTKSTRETTDKTPH